MMDLDRIYNMDCLEGMKMIPDRSVHAIICDLPYGTTVCNWDKILPLGKLWEQYNRILVDHGVVCLFGSEPFSTRLRMSNIDHYKYDWIWKKDTVTGFVHAKNMPLKDYELISVFSNAPMGHKSLLGEKRMTYNPQGIIPCNETRHSSVNRFCSICGSRPSHREYYEQEYKNYPTMTLHYKKEPKCVHPCQKPVELIRYLIRTYSDEGDTVLDNCIGSGTTAVAAIREKRHYIGFETESRYVDIATGRIAKERQDGVLFA